MRKRMKQFKFISLVAISLITTGCTTSLANLWENTKTGFRGATYASKAFITKDPSSRLVNTTAEFFGSLEAEFIPLSDQDMQSYTLSQAREVPGIPGGKVPGINSFQSPSKVLAATFGKIYFNTDQHTPKDKETLAAIHKMATFLKKHPSVYIFIFLHTDERAPEAYNLSLGTKRSNCIRNLLMKEGVNPERLFTISYGKERPESIGHSEKTWSKNRRVAFKLHDKEGKL